MTDRPIADEHRNLHLRLAASRLATRAAIVVERGWPLLLPLLIVVALLLIFAWFGLFSRLPDGARLSVLAVFGLAALAALYPLRFFRAPTPAEVDRRVEAANNLAHTPVLTQTDRPSGQPSSFSEALWREHQRRMAASLKNLGGDLPRTCVPEHDRWGLRAAVALVLVTAFAFSLGPRGGSIADAFSQRPIVPPIPPRIDAWVTPPAYTGKAPIFLTAETNQGATAFTVPEGSDVTLRVTGGTGDETLAYTEAGGNVRAIDPAAPRTESPKTGSGPDASKPAATASAQDMSAVRQFQTKLIREGELTLKSGDNQLGHWAFAITPDKPPEIKFVGEPKQAVNGAMELNYQILDDYGAASAKTDFALADPQAPNARPLYGAPEMPLALPRSGAKANGARTVKDLTEHVWAGTRIKLKLEATDGAGQTATSEEKTVTMPERPFSNPLARAVIEQRHLLGLDANAKPRVLDLMDAVTLRPEDTFDNMSNYLAIMSARSRLKLASTDEQLRDVVSYLWDIALGIEDGNLSDAEKRLRQAQQNLENLLKNGASDEEIDKAMQELRQAMNDFLREFAEKHKNDQTAAQSEDGREIRQSDLDKLMDQIQNLAKSGNKDQAQQLLSQLENMMNNLQAGRQQQGSERNSAMRQQMDKLGDIMRRQQEMMNDTFRMDQMQRNQGQNQQQGEGGDQSQQNPQDGQGQQQNGKPMTPQEFADALKQLQEGQGKLQGDLEQLKKKLEDMGMQPNEGFGEAGRAMGDAEGALGNGDPNQATGQQGKALEALRRGAQDMMKEMQAMQGDQGGSQDGGRRQDADRDPLGRPRATDGPDFGDSVKVPDEIDVQRARQILDAIRKRLGNALSPDIERSYLERLLDMK